MLLLLAVTYCTHFTLVLWYAIIVGCDILHTFYTVTFCYGCSLLWDEEREQNYFSLTFVKFPKDVYLASKSFRVKVQDTFQLFIVIFVYFSDDPRWCEWNDWSPCTATCTGLNSMQVRQRACLCPAPKMGQRSCQGL